MLGDGGMEESGEILWKLEAGFGPVHTIAFCNVRVFCR